MYQVIQYQKTGDMQVAELPLPMLKPNHVLVRNAYSLISAGTEKSSVQTAQASMVGKARSRPDLVRQVMENVRREGLRSTYDKVQNRLDNYKELGYSCAGVVLESAVEGIQPGDRVACAGGGYASHAEVVAIPKNLVARIPEGVDFAHAAFTTVASIAMQGVRQADVRLGETVAVIGLGLIGLLTIQLLKANGCRVIGLDISDDNFDKAREVGCDECALTTEAAADAVEHFTRGYGTDATLVTAATASNEPVQLALEIARQRSKVVIVGSVGMEIPRSPFYEKELDLRISCSYGPGRYDTDYEEKGQDYPIGFVRWTENRNMQSVLDLMAQGKLNVAPLISHSFDIKDALAAYDIITGKVHERYLGILIQYARSEEEIRKATPDRRAKTEMPGVKAVSIPAVGFIGAGNFAQSWLLPPIQQAGVTLRGVVTSKPVNARTVAQKFGFAFGSTNPDEVLEENETNTVFIASRHDSHAAYVQKALSHGKHVFVEKPLAVTEAELSAIQDQLAAASNGTAPILFTGFNRRFSQPFADIKGFFANRVEPLQMSYRVNAGFLPKSHWTQDPEQGGRIIGECCHFIDTLQFLAGAPPVSVYAACTSTENTQTQGRDNLSIILQFADGSVGTLLYLSGGDRGVSKEYVEVHGGGQSAIFDQFRTVRYHRNGSARSKRYNGDKGHATEVLHFLDCVRSGTAPSLSVDEIISTTRATLKTIESLETGHAVRID